MGALADLPNDLLLSILQLLGVQDILSARKTCQTLASVSRRRLLWLTALKAVCIEDGVFVSSFPTSQMSTKDIEAVASGPSRFISLLKCHGRRRGKATEGLDSQTTYMPGNRRSIRIHLSTPLFYRELPCIFLVPGGRFLIAHSSEEVQLWDLGIFFSAGSMEDPILVCQHTSQTECLVGWTKFTKGQTTPGCESLRIVHFLPMKVVVLEVCPADPNPRFKILNEASTRRPNVVKSSVCGNRIAFLYDSEPIIEVWDFVEDTWACFKIEQTARAYGRYCDRELILSPSLIVLIMATDVTIWNIPTLEPGRHNRRRSKMHTPLQSLHLSPTSLLRQRDSARHVANFTQPPEWYSDNNGQPIWFGCNATVSCQWEQDESRQLAVQRCRIEPASSNAFERHFLVEGSTRVLLPLRSTPHSSRMVGGKFASVTVLPDDGTCRYEMEVAGGSVDVFLSVPLMHPGSYSSMLPPTSSSFCPFSGRFCSQPHYVEDYALHGKDAKDGIQIDILDLFSRV